jgi:LysR family hydrogen peroxide-inducible transcriptional activator
VRIFEKNGGVTRTTPHGEVVVEAAREALEAAERVYNAARWSDVIKIGAIETIAPYLLPGAMRELRKKDPELRVAPTSGRTDALVSKLMEGAIDVLVLATSTPAGCQSYPLGRDEFMILTDSKARGTKPSLSKLRQSGVDLILLEDGHCLRTQALNACKIAAGGLGGGVVDGGSLDMVLEMVSAGLGATLIPQIAIKSIKHRDDLSVSELPAEERSGRDLSLVWVTGNRREREIVKIAEVLRSQARKLARS